MYYLAKLIQATGLTIIAFDFLKNFPQLMSMKILGMGIMLFTSGWLIQKFQIRH